MNYTLVHGVRSGNEAYDRKEYEADRYILCTSKESNNTAREKRVTMFLSKSKLTPDMLFYLCGNGNMIYEASRILKDKGIPAENIFTEIYF